MSKKPFSPCVGACTTGRSGDTICAGCMRTAQEVKLWNSFTDEQRNHVWNRLEAMDNYLAILSDLYERNPMVGITPTSFAKAAQIPRQESLRVLTLLLNSRRIKRNTSGSFIPVDAEQTI